MKRILSFAVTFFILAGVSASNAQNLSTTPSASGPTPSTTPGSTVKHHKKKKASVQATVQPTAQMTVSPTSSPSVTQTLPVKPTSTPTAMPTPTNVPESSSMGAIANSKIYDRMDLPGDLRGALFRAVKTLTRVSVKHGHTVFLDLEKVSANKIDKERRNAYARFEINELELGGARNPWILLAGTVFEQSGDDCKVDGPIEVAIDFKDIKINYGGSKMGEIQKGNDIAAQVYKKLISHDGYQLILQANDQDKDSKYMDDTAAYTVKARDGYVIMDFPNSSHEASR